MKEALANATQMGHRMDCVTFSTDADLQREFQREAHAELAKLDGEQMADLVVLPLMLCRCYRLTAKAVTKAHKQSGEPAASINSERERTL